MNWAQLAIVAVTPLLTAPQIHPDRSVTFALDAPRASSVSLWGDWMPGGTPVPMTRGSSAEAWSLTVPALNPGAYLYCFWVDGLRVADPRNRQVKNGFPGLSSILRIPGAPLPEPRGVAHVHVYRGSGGSLRRLHIYTPAGYEKRRGPWPVLYLLHGSSDSDRDWLELGQAGEILDRLISERRAKPMLLVMPDGHPYPSLDVSTRAKNLDVLAADLRDHIMPLAERNYQASSRPSRRAIAGASMGGVQALHLAALRPADFSAVAGFSAPGDVPSGRTLRQAWPVPGKKHAEPEFWLACGREDEFLPDAEKVAAYLRQTGRTIHWALTGGAHSWATWREHLELFLERLFR